MACLVQGPVARLGATSSSGGRNAVLLATVARAGRPLEPAAAAPARQQRRQQRQRQQRRRRGGSVLVHALRNIDWPEALLFDCDGVLVDTEAEGHRVAFNEAFKRKGACLAVVRLCWCGCAGAAPPGPPVQRSFALLSRRAWQSHSRALPKWCQ